MPSSTVSPPPSTKPQIREAAPVSERGEWILQSHALSLPCSPSPAPGSPTSGQFFFKMRPSRSAGSPDRVNVKQVTLVHQLDFQLKSCHIHKYQHVGPTKSYTVSDTQLGALLGRQQPSNCLTCIQNRCSHILGQGPPPSL